MVWQTYSDHFVPLQQPFINSFCRPHFLKKISFKIYGRIFLTINLFERSIGINNHFPTKRQKRSPPFDELSPAVNRELALRSSVCRAEFQVFNKLVLSPLKTNNLQSVSESLTHLNMFSTWDFIATIRGECKSHSQPISSHLFKFPSHLYHNFDLSL